MKSKYGREPTRVRNEQTPKTSDTPRATGVKVAATTENAAGSPTGGNAGTRQAATVALRRRRPAARYELLGGRLRGRERSLFKAMGFGGGSY